MIKRIVTPLAAAAVIAAAGSLSTPSPALAACNPDDCRGISKEELARDKAEIRRLNREQLRYVQRRDSEYAKGWEANRQYEDDRADYERRMAQWREAVRRCRAGDYRYCAY